MNDMGDQLQGQLEQGFPIRDDNGRVVLRIGLLATLYFDEGHTGERRAAVGECVDDYLRMCGPELRWGLHPKGGGFQDLARKPVPTPSEYFASRSPSENDLWEFYYHGGDPPEEASDLRVKGLGARKWQSEGKGQLSYFSVALPITWFADREGNFVELVLSWCGRLKPVHGYGGLGILDSPDVSLAQRHAQQAYGLARRFPGLEADYPVSHVHYLKDGIKGVNWLTVLGESWLKKAGGVSGLRDQLGEPFRFFEFDGGLLIQAGPMPQMGDSNRELSVPEYRRLAQLLKSIRVTDHKAFPAWSGFDAGRTNSWLARFD
ncbi:MAG TPA: type VI immunity family protein [Gemmatimonadota bacterium]|nr:type VI immunity family protein [Gemmatimonadota bacterium]